MKHLKKFTAIILILLILLVGCEEISEPEDTSAPIIDCIHSDDDNNGKCDICEISVIVTIDFYAINDLHGKFSDTSSNAGVDELTTFLKRRYELDDNVILLSSGDMWQGSSESNITKGAIITDWMNELNFASMTLGNHEFDWDEEYIEANDEIADFPFLAINIYDRDTNKRVEYCDASTVIEHDGIQIGIIGAIGDCYSSISGDRSEDVYFKTGDELTRLVKEESVRLRESGVDFIVYSIHDGYGKSKSSESYVSSGEISSYYDTELSDGYVDLVFEGHTHQSYILVDEYGVKHAQGGGENKGIAHIEIKINSVNYNFFTSSSEFIKTSAYSNLEDDPVVNELLEKYKDEISIADEVLGSISRKRSSTEIKKLVAELYFKKGFERWGEKYDITLGGGFVSTRSPYDLAAGSVKYKDIQSILPFDNQLVLCSVKGEDLLRRFINTDNDNYYVFTGEYGQSVLDDIDKDAVYYIVTDKYSSTYAPNRLTEIEAYDADVFARDLVAEFIKNGGWKNN